MRPAGESTSSCILFHSSTACSTDLGSRLGCSIATIGVGSGLFDKMLRSRFISGSAPSATWALWFRTDTTATWSTVALTPFGHTLAALTSAPPLSSSCAIANFSLTMAKSSGDIDWSPSPIPRAPVLNVALRTYSGATCHGSSGSLRNNSTTCTRLFEMAVRNPSWSGKSL